MDVKITSNFDDYIEKIYQDLLRKHLQKDPILLNTIMLLLSEDTKFKLDPKLGLTMKYLEKLADEIITKKYKDRPEMLEYFDRFRGIQMKDLVQEFAEDLENHGFKFKTLEFHPNRLEKNHIRWLEQQALLSLDPPLIQKKNDKVKLPLLLVFDQFRNDFNFIIDVFFKPYIRTILKQDPNDFYYRSILTEVMKEEDSLWNHLSVENFSIIRNSIVRNHFLISDDNSIQFFIQKKGLKKKIKLTLSQTDCLVLALILNQSVWLLMLTWIDSKNFEDNNSIPDLKDKIKEMKEIWMNNDILKKRLDHFSQTQFGRAIKNSELELSLSIGRYNSTVNRKMKMNYLQESLIYFLGTLGSHINELFHLSIEASNRIAYMYVYNTAWTEYLFPIGKWVIEKQGMTQPKYFDIWKELLNYSNGKYANLFRIFSPIIRNAFVHGEYYKQEDHSYIFHSIEYPEFAPIHITPFTIDLFHLKSFFDHYLHPNIFLGYEKLGLAKHWIELVEKKEKTTKEWQRQIEEMEILEHDVLGVMMRVKLISKEFSLGSVNIIQNEIEKLFKDRLVAINDQNVLVLVVVSIFLHNRGNTQLYLLMERITNFVDEFFLPNPKMKILLFEMKKNLAKRRKAWGEVKKLQKKIKVLKKDRE